jgi:hypothetical protein
MAPSTISRAVVAMAAGLLPRNRSMALSRPCSELPATLTLAMALTSSEITPRVRAPVTSSSIGMAFSDSRLTDSTNGTRSARPPLTTR